MKRKAVIIIILVIFILILGGCFAAIKLLSKDDKKLNKNTLENNLFELDNIESKIIENENSNIELNNVLISETEDVNNIKKEENTEEKAENKGQNTNISSNISKNKDTNNTQSIEATKVENKSEEVANNTSKEETKKENIESSNNTVNENVEKEENSNSSLANATYRVTNTEVLTEIKSILENEISKDKDLVEFGTKVVTSSKSNAYANATGFTYMLVDKVENGKVEGNYQKFEQRVKNNVGAFGTYYIYAEDEFTYNSQGLNPKWSQTLVWIYVKF
jgi:hypothetical protein